MTEPTDEPQPDTGAPLDPELTADLTAELGGATSFFPPADGEQADELGSPPDGAPLAPAAPEPTRPGDPGPEALAPGEPGTAGAALADLAGGYGGSYEPYYGTPSPWSSNRLEAIMRDSVDAQVQEQRQLETLLVDVREALTGLAGPAPSPASAAAQTEAIDRLAGELAAARAEQEQRFADLSARIDALASHGTGQEGTPAGPGIQDLHDGLAGVRTDMASLPEQIGPAVTSAVAHGIADTSAQVGSLRQSLADTATETGELRALVAEHAEHLGLLPEAVAGIRDLTARLADLEAAAPTGTGPAAPTPPAPIGPEIAAVVDQQLGAHLETFGVGVGEQLNAVRAQLAAVEESLVATVHDRLGAFEERLDALHEVLVALHGSGERELPPALVVRLDELESELRSMRLASEGPASPMTSVVAQLHASEQRLAHHVDEAVLALAQAVLRRRAGGGASSPRDELPEPELPADELAAAAMDDVHPDEGADPSADSGSDADADADGGAGAATGTVEAWAKGDGEAVELGDDGEGGSVMPEPDVQPGPTPPGQDPRRGLFRRRA